MEDKQFWKGWHILFLLMITFFFIPVVVENWFRNLLHHYIVSDMVVGTIQGLVISLVFISCIWGLRKLSHDQLTWAQRFGLRSFQPHLLWRLTFVLLFVFFISLLSIIAFDLILSYQNSKEVAVQQNFSYLTVILAVFSGVIVSPIYEEIIYRGVFDTYFRNRFGNKTGMLISSLIFSFAHLPEYNILFTTLLTGLAFSWAYQKTSSLWASIMMHALSNLLFLIVMLFFL